MMRPGPIIVVTLIWSCSSHRSRELDLSAPVRLPDAGLAVVFEDGTIAATAERSFEECHTDAGAFLALVSERECDSDSDCVPFRHGLAAAGLRVCYPIRSALRGSYALARERRILAQACGFATIYSNDPCEHTACVAHRCEFIE